MSIHPEIFLVTAFSAAACCSLSISSGSLGKERSPVNTHWPLLGARPGDNLLSQHPYQILTRVSSCSARRQCLHSAEESAVASRGREARAGRGWWSAGGSGITTSRGSLRAAWDLVSEGSRSKVAYDRSDSSGKSELQHRLLVSSGGGQNRAMGQVCQETEDTSYQQKLLPDSLQIYRVHIIFPM